MSKYIDGSTSTASRRHADRFARVAAITTLTRRKTEMALPKLSPKDKAAAKAAIALCHAAEAGLLSGNYTGEETALYCVQTVEDFTSYPAFDDETGVKAFVLGALHLDVSFAG